MPLNPEDERELKEPEKTPEEEFPSQHEMHICSSPGTMLL